MCRNISSSFIREIPDYYLPKDSYNPVVVILVQPITCSITSHEYLMNTLDINKFYTHQAHNL